MNDRVGIGWRAELASGILSNLGDIDVVEVMADDLFDRPGFDSRRAVRAIQTLSVQVPVVLHGVSLGLASAAPVEPGRLDRFARVAAAIQPDFWSEHLAFVRSEGLEIGHLAAPPRTEATVEGAARNIHRAEAVVGSRPLVENVATLIDPPGSTCDEPAWIAGVLAASSAGLLLDLNNLHANCVNFGQRPEDFLARIPFDRVAAIHLAGGKWISAATGERRLLDDHLHDVPGEVYELLAEAGARARRPLTVILERDGAYPPFEQLLEQLARARAALAAGRRRAVERSVLQGPLPSAPGGGGPAGPGPGLEAFLARLYLDAEARSRFLADPRGEARRAGFPPDQCDALAHFDRVGLELASQSFERKRSIALMGKRGAR
ncbi:MAG TPA: DUF692 family protein [Myxococcales bacterium]|nr:DUF692 family protein [Myxococcales bacterium]